MWILVPFVWPPCIDPFKDYISMGTTVPIGTVRFTKEAWTPEPKAPWLVRRRWAVFISLLVVTICTLPVMIAVSNITNPPLWATIPAAIAMVLLPAGTLFTLVVLHNYILPNRKSRQQEVEPTITWEGYSDISRERPR